jgi:hypothetical protein
MNGYIAFFKGQRKEVYANTSYEAQLAAIELFRPKAKDKHMVHVHLAEKDGQPVVHKPLF